MYLLITGATGHIGSCIAKKCNDRKIKTILLTRSEKKSKILKKKFRNCIILTNKNLKKNNYNISTVIHTASINDKDSNKNDNSISQNLNITVKIFESLNIKNLKKIIYLSSAQVYGSNLIGKVKETTPLLPINNYGISRCFNELFLKKFSNNHNKNLIILRVSNVVGEPTISNRSCLRLLPNDIKNQSKLSGKLILRSSGLQYRNFLSINFLTNTILKLIKKKTKKVLIFNLGGVNVKIIGFINEFTKIYNQNNKKKLKILILSNKPKTSEKLNYDDHKIRLFLRLNKKENINNITKIFLRS